MNDNPTRPRFSADNARPIPRAEAARMGPEPSNGVAPLDHLADDALELKPEERAVIADGLIGPTVSRIYRLVKAVVDLTQSGDVVLFVPLAAMDNLIRDLQWDQIDPVNGQKMLMLIDVALRRYADIVRTQRNNWIRWQALGAQGPRPTLDPWTADDSLACYAIVNDAVDGPTPPPTPDPQETHDADPSGPPPTAGDGRPDDAGEKDPPDL